MKELQLAPLPTNRYDPINGMYAIGVVSPSSTIYGMKEFPKGTLLDRIKPDLRVGDRVVSLMVNPYSIDARFEESLGSELTAALQAKWDKPFKLGIERPGEARGCVSDKG